MISKKIIVALDNSDIKKVKKVVKNLKSEVFAFKIGYEFFFNYGINGYNEIKNICPNIFLDLKLHDIPNTIQKGIKAIDKLRPLLTTIHISGGDEMTMSNNDQTYYFKPRYSGSSFTVGLLHVLSKNLQYGVSIDMPTSLNVEELYTESDHVNGDLSFSETYNYNVKKPLTFHGGAAILLKSVNFFYELEYTDWRSLEFSSDDIYEADLELPASVVINNEIRETFSSTTSHHFGFAMRVPVLPVHLFAGYQILPVPFSNQYDNNLRESFSFGCSVAIKKNVTLQASYDNYIWNYDGSPENFDKISIGISLHEIPGI